MLAVLDGDGKALGLVVTRKARKWIWLRMILKSFPHVLQHLRLCEVKMLIIDRASFTSISVRMIRRVIVAIVIVPLQQTSIGNHHIIIQARFSVFQVLNGLFIGEELVQNGIGQLCPERLPSTLQNVPIVKEPIP